MQAMGQAMEEVGINSGQGAEATRLSGVLSWLAKRATKTVAGFGKRAGAEIRNHPAETVAAAAACGVMVAMALRPARRSRRRSSAPGAELHRGQLRPGDRNL